MPTLLDFFKPVRTDANAPLTSSSDVSTTQLTKSSGSESTAELETSETFKRPIKRRKATSDDDLMPSTASVTLSEYEQKRLERVAANAKFLRELGMTSAQLEMTAQKERVSKIPQTKKPLKTEKLPVRRSRRLRGDVVLGSDRLFEQEKKETKGPTLSFTESNVFRYSVDEKTESQMRPPSLSGDNPDGKLMGFQVDATASLYDPNLKKAYAISFTTFHDNGLVAAGGHGGHVSIFAFAESCHRSNTVVQDHPPLMSFKAHSGWISAISLARSIHGKTNVLLTASNDASLKMWDLNHSSTTLNVPNELFNQTCRHEKGIFGMDVCNDAVVTCSKDASIVLSHFRSDTGVLEVTRRFDEHESVVKCVRFAPSNPQTFASGGNDRVLRVYDTRVATQSNVLAIRGIHSRAINSVQFHPTDDNLVLSAGFDPDFFLFDLRKVSSPLCTFRQSSQSKDNNSKTIFHPIFVQTGHCVVAARGHDLSLYRTSDGSVVSHGTIEEEATCIAADPFYDRIALAQGSRLRFANAEFE